MILSFSLIVKMGVIINWKLNQSYITKNLCEKRNQKNNCCKGSCRLNKQLKNIDRENAPKLPQTKFHVIDSFIIETSTKYICTNTFFTNEKKYSNYMLNYYFYFYKKPVKPPIV